MELWTPQFWVAALEIIVINILLSGDNAVVIALACRNLAAKQRKLGIFWGVIGAVVLRIILTFFAVQLLQLPYLQLVGGALLIWIGIKLVAEDGPADAPVVLLLHGEPSWSYLYRKMVPPLVAAGHRVVAPDLLGFGRSDKPADRADYTYERHVGWMLGHGTTTVEAPSCSATRAWCSWRSTSARATTRR